MVIPGFGVLRNATPVVAWFGLSSHPVVAGFRAPDGPAAVVAGFGMGRPGGHGRSSRDTRRHGRSVPAVVIDQLRLLGLTRRPDRDLVAEGRIAGQTGDRRCGGHPAGGNRRAEDEQETFHDALPVVRMGHVELS